MTRYSQDDYDAVARTYGQAMKPCAGPDASPGVEPCPHGFWVRDGAGWCYECQPRTVAVERT